MPNLAAPFNSTGFAVLHWIVKSALAALVALLLFAAGASVRAQNAAEDQGVLAGFLSRLLSTPTPPSPTPGLLPRASALRAA